MACEQLGRPISVLVSTVAIEFQFRAVTFQQFKDALQHYRDISYRDEMRQGENRASVIEMSDTADPNQAEQWQ